jgi:anthranilate synthase component 1
VNDVFVIDFDYTHGGGIVADSVPAAEYQETLDKARALLEAIDLARSP